MCGIVGFTSIDMPEESQIKIITDMKNALLHRGPDSNDIWVSEKIAFGHTRLAIIDIEGGAQPMKRKIGDNEYVIVYNGELYNTSEIRSALESFGHKFRTNSDTEVVLLSYIHWGPSCLARLNGIFAFGVWNSREQSLFLARDRFGVKPLYFTDKNNQIIFASEIKSLLENPYIEAVIDNDGIAEIFALAPTHTPGFGVFKDISELKPAHFLIWQDDKITIRRYWEFESHEHEDNLGTTAEKLRSYVGDAVARQLVSDVPLATFLSGGLDSSTITAITANQYARHNGSKLSTYSFDYKDNGKFFKGNNFQPDDDKRWVDKVVREFKTNHTYLMADVDDLTSLLYEAVKAKDLPGMADIDSSLLYFCREVKNHHSVVLSGESADEILGGYPWFHNSTAFEKKGFPWIYNLEERAALLNADTAKYADIDNYVMHRYIETIEKTPRLVNENSKDSRRRELFYLNICWFMTNLLTRKDRMSMASGLEVRVPFTDHNLAQYVWNIPWNMKSFGGREKGILRLALKGLLPDEILERKKSPYPKTHNPNYEKTVAEELKNVLHSPHAKINQLVNRQTIESYMQNPSKSNNPFFGQLMSRPQLYGFLLQVNFWLEYYKISIK
ncbi:MAG: asparagine synthase (glutamine-hydrolyzing) [Clostridiales bacterium]|jgi:asparagine synthase (glutamine-hydrolysing)|nr:asparagine synthase (glutamine-hydrolyzing) [Clostridiales bacterium]